MSDKIIFTRLQLYTIIITLEANSFEKSALSACLTLKRFFVMHPDQQLFTLSAEREHVK